MKVLLVDDEEKFVSSLAQRLRLRGFEADWAATCDDAISRVKKERYDLAVLDVKMPCMSGLELKKRLEQIWPGMKFIFVTGHGSEKDYENGCREGFCYIIKPFKIQTLVERMKQALEIPAE
jgi:DNA-binding response OmpR family regulator